MHNDNEVFNPASEEALIPVNLMIYQNSFALYLITNMDNPMTPCRRPLGKCPVREDPSFLYRHRGLSHQRLVNLT
jgi:hypothetical protein